MKKHTLWAELAYIFGIMFLAFGTALMEKAAFGMSMVVSPAYILHVKLSELFPFFTFGMAEYTFQALLLVILCVATRKIRLIYLFSFVTAVIYGFTLDGAILLSTSLPASSMGWRVLWYLLGMLLCSMGVALLFRTYIAPEAYELFVKVIAEKKGWEISRVKTVYDCVSCLVSVILSFAFFGFGKFVGVNWGTIVCALVNGSIIGLCSHAFDRFFVSSDALPLRKYFQ